MTQPRKLALFLSCLVTMFRPAVAKAGIKLLSSCGYDVAVPHAQTCCGQPGYNSGNLTAARQVARRTMRCLAPYGKVIVPSGSCAGMIKKHYPALFEDADGTPEKNRAEKQAALELAAKTEELTSFLAGEAGLAQTGYKTTAPQEPLSYHHSCSSLRELGVKQQPLQLLQECCGMETKELPHAEVCCGFGGTFCIKYPRISARMADDKLDEVMEAKACLVTAADMGCLLQLAGRAKKRKLPLSFYHISELLAGDTNTPSI